MPKTHYFRKAF